MAQTQGGEMMASNMYAKAKTYSPAKGCGFGCSYCEYTFQKQAKRQKHLCKKCYNYEPHTHPERLDTSKIPSAEIVFVCGNGDPTFYPTDFIEKIIDVIKEHNERCPYKTYYFQSKNPRTFERFKDELPENCILLTTLETNRDEGYSKLSSAPLPSTRCKDFKRLDYPRKVITVEPVMDFDLVKFFEMLISSDIEYLWFGFDSRPKKVKHPEPSEEKAQKLVNYLTAYGVEIRGKSLRGIELKEVSE